MLSEATNTLKLASRRLGSRDLLDKILATYQNERPLMFEESRETETLRRPKPHGPVGYSFWDIITSI